MKLDVRLDEVFAQPPERLWHAITDARMLARWLMENDFEPRLGHRFTLRDPPTAGWRGTIDCEVLELDPPRRMVWSWYGGREGEVTTRVVFELQPAGAGTRLLLRHEGEALPIQVEGFTAGWPRKLVGLGHALAPDYARRLPVAAPAARLFDAVATVEGLRGWWTTHVGGAAVPGATLHLGFEGSTQSIVMRVDAVDAPTKVRWTCVDHSALPEWIGTELWFDVAVRGTSSELGFRHVGLVPALACWAECERGWDRVLESLAALVQHGRGRPIGG